MVTYWNLIGDELLAAGDIAGAIKQYRAALQAPSLTNSLLIEIKIAQAHAALSDYETALGMYQDIYNRAQTDFTKSQMDYLMGQTFMTLGQAEQAYAAYQDAVDKFPATNTAYLSLLELVNAGVPVDELDRGIVDHYAGQYGVALAAFDRYFQAGGRGPGHSPLLQRAHRCTPWAGIRKLSASGIRSSRTSRTTRCGMMPGSKNRIPNGATCRILKGPSRLCWILSPLHPRTLGQASCSSAPPG